MVLEKSYHEILKKRVTVEINGNTLKLSVNQGIDVENFKATNLQGLGSYQVGTVNVHQKVSVVKNLKIPISNTFSQCIIPSTLIWSQTAVNIEPIDVNYKAAKFQKEIEDNFYMIPKDFFPRNQQVGLVSSQEEMPTIVKVRKTSRSKAPKISQDFYEHLKGFASENFDLQNTKDNYRHAFETAAMRVHRLARLYSALASRYF